MKYLLYFAIFISTSLCSFAQKVDHIDIWEEANNPYSAHRSRLNEVLFEAVKNGHIQAYSPDSGWTKLTPDDVRKEMILDISDAEYEFDIDNDDDFCWCGDDDDDDDITDDTEPEYLYYFPSDYSVYSIQYDASGSPISLTISLAAYHPDNIKGILAPLMKFKWNDFAKVTNSNPGLNWKNPLNHSDSTSFHKALEEKLYATSPRQHNPSESLSRNLELIKKLRERAATKPLMIECAFQDRHDVLVNELPGFQRGDKSLAFILINAVNNGELDPYSSPDFSLYKWWNEENLTRMTNAEVKERYIMEDEGDEFEEMFDDEDDDWGDDWGNEEDETLGYVFPVDEMLVSTTGTIRYMNNGKVARTNRFLSVYLPSYHPDNIRGFNYYICVLKYQDVLNHLKTLEESNPKKYVWTNPFDLDNKEPYSKALVNGRFWTQITHVEDPITDEYIYLIRDSIKSFKERNLKLTISHDWDEKTMNVVRRKVTTNEYINNLITLAARNLRSENPFRSTGKNRRELVQQFSWDQKEYDISELAFKLLAKRNFYDSLKADFHKISGMDDDTLKFSKKNNEFSIVERKTLTFENGKYVSSKSRLWLNVKIYYYWAIAEFEPELMKKMKFKKLYKSWKKGEFGKKDLDIKDSFGQRPYNGSKNSFDMDYEFSKYYFYDFRNHLK